MAKLIVECGEEGFDVSPLEQYAAADIDSDAPLAAELVFCGGEDIRALIRRVGQDRTVLLSTHILQEVNALCNRVVIINHGRIVGDYDDLPAMLAGDGRHRRFEVQFLHAPQRDTLARIGDIYIIKEYDERHFLVAAGRDVRGDLFDLAVATGNKLLLLRPVEDTIEEVFRQLTNDK